MTCSYLTTEPPFTVTREQCVAALDAGCYAWVSDGVGNQLMIETLEQEGEDDGGGPWYLYDVEDAGGGDPRDDEPGGLLPETGEEAVTLAEQCLAAHVAWENALHEEWAREEAADALSAALGTQVE